MDTSVHPSKIANGGAAWFEMMTDDDEGKGRPAPTRVQIDSSVLARSGGFRQLCLAHLQLVGRARNRQRVEPSPLYKLVRVVLHSIELEFRCM